VVQQIASGAQRPAQVCREHQLAETVLLRGRREYEARGEAAFTPPEAVAGSAAAAAEQRVAELERCCGQLAVENAARNNAVQHVQHVQHVQAPQASASKTGAR
jgi:transposase